MDAKWNVLPPPPGAEAKPFAPPGSEVKVDVRRHVTFAESAGPRFGVSGGNVICADESVPGLCREIYAQQIAHVEAEMDADLHFGLRRNRCRVMLRLRRKLRRKMRRSEGRLVRFGRAHALAVAVPHVHPAIKQEAL